MIESDRNEGIQCLVGSSGGAIAAAVVGMMPDRLEEYASAFVQRRGGGLDLLQHMLLEEDEAMKQPSREIQVCATKCLDGSAHLFRFPANQETNRERLVRCVRASCSIPLSFHPWDILSSSSPVTYPESEGLEIDGDFFVDGGIAAPAPPTPAELQRLVVSPISGGSKGERISPDDDTLGGPFDLPCRGGFSVRPSLQNARALQIAMGGATSAHLQKWYDLGQKDAERYLLQKP